MFYKIKPESPALQCLCCHPGIPGLPSGVVRLFPGCHCAGIWAALCSHHRSWDPFWPYESDGWSGGCPGTCIRKGIVLYSARYLLHFIFVAAFKNIIYNLRHCALTYSGFLKPSITGPYFNATALEVCVYSSKYHNHMIFTWMISSY